MTDRDRARLARLLGMLGSEFEGERENASRLIEAFRKRHGLTWAEMLAAHTIVMPEVEPEPPRSPPPASPASVRFKPAWPIHDKPVMAFAAVWVACLIFLFVYQNI